MSGYLLLFTHQSQPSALRQLSLSLVLPLACLLICPAGCQQPVEPGSGLSYEESLSRDEEQTAAAPSGPSDRQSDGTGEIGSTDDHNVQVSLADSTDSSTAMEGGTVTSVPSGEGVANDQTAAADAGQADGETANAVTAVDISEQLANITLLVPEKVFFRVGADRNTLRVQFDDIDLEKVLNMTYIPRNAPEYFPEWLQELDGKRVRLRGYMYTTVDGVSNFLFVRDLGPCCFGPNPRSDYRIPVTLKDGELTNYIHHRVFEVEGTFHIHISIDHLGKVAHVYAMTDATIIHL